MQSLESCPVVMILGGDGHRAARCGAKVAVWTESFPVRTIRASCTEGHTLDDMIRDIDRAETPGVTLLQQTA